MEVSIGDFKIQDGQYIAIDDRWFTLGELRAIIQEWARPKKKSFSEKVQDWMAHKDEIDRTIDPSLYDL